MQAKTTRAFRTISEAAEELDLQPHVLRFWESKFPHFKPIKRGGGRRFYRPDDIEFLRGIKILLHDERHPIKDVQKLIRVKGVNRVIELGRSIEQAAVPKAVKDTVLVPERIRTTKKTKKKDRKPVKIVPMQAANEDDYSDSGYADKTEAEEELVRIPDPQTEAPAPVIAEPVIIEKAGLTDQERNDLELALERLQNLRSEWDDFTREIAAE